MASFNVNFQGRLGQDLKTLQNGSLTFSVAVDNHDKEKTTTWVTCFIANDNQRLFDRASKWLKKGSGVSVQGGLSLNNYTNKDGVQVTSLNVNVTDFDFTLSSGQRNDGQQAAQPAAAQSAPAMTTASTAAPAMTTNATAAPAKAAAQPAQTATAAAGDETSDLPF